MASRKRINLANSFSRSIKSFFSISHEKVDGGEAVQKKRMEADLDGEMENEMKNITAWRTLLVYTSVTPCLTHHSRSRRGTVFVPKHGKKTCKGTD